MQHMVTIRQIATAGVPTSLLPELTLAAGQEVIIGREPSCQLALNPNLYTMVSRRHAMIRPSGQDWEVNDLGSANGTYVNGKLISKFTTLQGGDRLTFGEDGPEFSFEMQAIAASISTVAIDLGEAVTPKKSDESSLTLTQLFPIAATGKDLSNKAFLVPGVLTVICVVLMFASIGEPVFFNFLISAYLAGAAYFYIYQLCGKRKPWWVLMSALMITILMLVTPVIDLFIIVFRGILPGGLYEDSGIISLFIGMFFGAGLMEEILKAIPVFLFYFIGLKLSAAKRSKIGVSEPLDGILIGTASAVGFTLLETLGQYVPSIINEVSMQADASTGELLGLQLLIPRILGSVAGHMAYSGYFGYFIGLSVLKPSKRWTILIIGCLTASLLHALWNTVGSYSSILLTVVGILSYAFLAAAILKARALSPNRSDNFATRIAK